MSIDEAMHIAKVVLGDVRVRLELFRDEPCDIPDIQHIAAIGVEAIERGIKNIEEAVKAKDQPVGLSDNELLTKLRDAAFDCYRYESANQEEGMDYEAASVRFLEIIRPYLKRESVNVEDAAWAIIRLWEKLGTITWRNMAETCAKEWGLPTTDIEDEAST